MPRWIYPVASVLALLLLFWVARSVTSPPPRTNRPQMYVVHSVGSVLVVRSADFPWVHVLGQQQQQQWQQWWCGGAGAGWPMTSKEDQQ